MIIIINDQPLVSSYILYKLIFAKFHSNLLDVYISTEVFLTCS